MLFAAAAAAAYDSGRYLDGTRRRGVAMDPLAQKRQCLLNHLVYGGINRAKGHGEVDAALDVVIADDGDTRIRRISKPRPTSIARRS